MNTQLDDWSIY